MSEYRPEVNDYVAYSDNEVFIVWNGSATFSIYERTGSSSKLINVITEYDIEDYEDAQGYAYDWVEKK